MNNNNSRPYIERLLLVYVRVLSFGRREREADAEGDIGIHPCERDTLFGEFTPKTIGGHKEVESRGVECKHTPELSAGSGEGRAQTKLNCFDRAYPSAEHRGVPVVDVVHTTRMQNAHAQFLVKRQGVFGTEVERRRETLSLTFCTAVV